MVIQDCVVSAFAWLVPGGSGKSCHSLKQLHNRDFSSGVFPPFVWFSLANRQIFLLVYCCNTLILKNKNLRSVAISRIIFECCRQRSYTQGLIQKKPIYLMLIKFKTNEKPMFFVIIKHIIWSLQTLNGLKGPYMVPTIISAGSIIPSPVSWTCWVFSIVLFKGSYLPLLSNK